MSFYEITNRAGKLSIRHEDYIRNIRIERYFGEDYSIINIQKQIKNAYLSKSVNKAKNKNQSINLLEVLMHPKYNSFYGMYMRYCKLLNSYSQIVKKYYIPSSIIEDVKIMDEYSKQAIFLAKNEIKTEEDFIIYADIKIEKLVSLKNEREELWRKMKKSPINDESIKSRINSLTKEINELSNEVKLCEKIRKRKNIIKENLEIIKGKELNIDEHIK